MRTEIDFSKHELLVTERFVGKILSYTVSRDVNRWLVSIAYELPNPSCKIINNEIIGVDLGLKHLATLSDGIKVENPKYFKKSEKKLS
jgi:putative transposase